MIDYSVLGAAQEYYSQKGYTYIEVPWLVSKAIDEMTKPSGIASYNVIKGDKEKRFIGSGEQGFLYLVAKGHLPLGKFYQTTTPCIRNDSFDQTHSKYFMKSELIFVTSPGKNINDQFLEFIVQDAFNFFAKYVDRDLLKKVKTEDGIDIEFMGVELGSYGIRRSTMCKWVYGTGVAEPRFSRMIRAHEGPQV